MYANPNEKHRLAGAQSYELLDRLCQAIEPTDTHHQTAKSRYAGVGAWLAASPNALLGGANIYAHGSFGIGTVVRPVEDCEYDVDLIAFIPGFPIRFPPSYLKKLVGARLRENRIYAGLMEEKQRCWRLNYAGEFHMDITPSIYNPDCLNGGELVPEKATDTWKASNPKGYQDLFAARANLRPRLRVTEAIAADSERAEVEAFPEQRTRKAVLQRTVQVCKRHRDVYFANRNPERTPISIVITTLASRAYESCVRLFEYDGAFDLLCDVVARMVDFIDLVPGRGRSTGWAIWNETTQGENFAEKWNANPGLVEAFFEWHRQICDDLAVLKAGHGLDQIGTLLGVAFGGRAASAAMDAMTSKVLSARSSEKLSIAAAAGLVTGAAPARATPVRPNTFFGR